MCLAAVACFPKTLQSQNVCPNLINQWKQANNRGRKCSFYNVTRGNLKGKHKMKWTPRVPAKIHTGRVWCVCCWPLVSDSLLTSVPLSCPNVIKMDQHELHRMKNRSMQDLQTRNYARYSRNLWGILVQLVWGTTWLNKFSLFIFCMSTPQKCVLLKLKAWTHWGSLSRLPAPGRAL